MLMREKKHQQQSRYSKKRLIFTAIGGLLLFGGIAVVWIFDNGPWSKVLSVVFAVLGVAVALFPLLLPFFESPRNFMDTNLIESDHEEPKKLHIRVEGVDLGIDGQIGALIIYTKKSKLGESVNLYRNHIQPLRHSTQNIVTYVVDNQTVYAAIFPILEPGDYIARTLSKCYETKITVLPNQLTKIDWRGSGIRQNNHPNSQKQRR